ncbi:TDO2 [Mytilus coruscus]|uniref:TDO2 n=1 Tax=Mytilus coruscus TaxID=42192 RepID=A0A6J8DK19_MYTCO|nr:TDO2 [Mytilus coruscus]
MEGESRTTAFGKANGDTSLLENAKSYESYFQIDKVLGGVRLLSVANKDPVHDEHLFIVIHQAFELWFKQMLFDMESIIKIFDSTPAREEKHMLTVTQRHLLKSASGFQSFQFRLLENKIGIREEDRIKHSNKSYIDMLETESSKETLRQSAKDKTLFSVVQAWLETIDEIDSEFWQRYVKAAEKSADKASFQGVIDKDIYESDHEKGIRRLSHKAFKGGLRISHMRDEPGYCLPYKVLSLLTDVDGLIMKWRYDHVLMVHRMIGSKTGTGGSSGYQYLQSTVSDKYRIFIDFFNMSTFLIPRRDLEAVKDTEVLKFLK